MKLTRLNITRLPGIEPGFELRDLDPGLNLITGPNAVGKSSLIRALEYLAGGVRSDDPQSLVLEAEFNNGARWTVNRTASHVQWHRDGEPVEAGPRLPARDELHCYWLKVEDLLADDTRQDAVLVAEIRQALAGGFNLPALRSGVFDYGSGKGRKEGRELQEASRHLNEVVADNQALQRDEQRLERLKREVAAARQGARERDVLSRAIELATLFSERRGLEAVLSGFPEGMEKLRGDEAERLEKLDQQLAELREDRLRIRERIEGGKRALLDAAVPDRQPAAHELKAARQRLDTLAERARDIEQLQAEATRLQAEADVARRPLQGQAVESGRPPDVSLSTLEQALGLAVELRKRESDIERLTSRIDAAGEAPDARRLDAHQQAVSALRTWLGGQGDADPTLFSNRGAAVLSAVGGLGAGAGALVTALWWLWLPAVLSLGAAWLMFRRQPGDGGRHAREQFEHSGLKAPDKWTRSAVQKRLAELESDHAELQLARRRADAVAEDRAERDRLQQQLDTLNRDKRELAGKIGFDPALSAASMHLFAKTVGDWQRAVAELEKSEASLRQLESRQKHERESLQQTLQAWGMTVSADLPALDAALNDLMARCERAQTAERERAAAEDRLHQMDRQLAERESERRTLFAHLGLDEQDRTALDERLASLKEWRETQDSLRALARRETELRESLAQAPKRLGQAEDGEHDALDQALQRANDQADLLEDLLQEVSAIQERLRAAGKDQALEKAMANEARARNALREQYQQAMLAETGQFLLDEVEAEYQSEHEPVVLADARQLFQRFTHHAFDVALDDEQGLMADDRKLGGRCSLSELSSGTRMQLLLSLRLAWTRQLEKRCEPLPLFLDEALTTSDEGRFRAVAESLSALAREEGRQIFYLSARQQERALWEQLTGLQPHHVDLADIRFGRTSAGVSDYAVPALASLPEPAGRSAEEWAAAVGIAALDPRRPAGAMPLFYLLRDDLPLLHRLMQDWRVSTLGQLEALLAADVAAKAVPESATRRQLQGRCQAAREWQRAWQHGRGQPVDRAVLEASGAVSENYIDAASELADRLGGDGEALLAALEEEPLPSSAGGNPRRLNKSKREELDDFLRHQGYVSEETPLDQDARLQRTLWAAAREADNADTRQLVAWLEAGADRQG